MLIIPVEENSEPLKGSAIPVPIRKPAAPVVIVLNFFQDDSPEKAFADWRYGRLRTGSVGA